jgi:hypothetical protein
MGIKLVANEFEAEMNITQAAICEFFHAVDEL